MHASNVAAPAPGLAASGAPPAMGATPGTGAPIVAAYYYPGWHRCPERRVRGADTEWNLLYDDVARSAYPRVRRPLHAPAEFSAAGLEAETHAAAQGGIDAFLWCWYWDRGRLIFNEALDTFLECNLPEGFKYALMWVNKRPHFDLPLDRTLSAAEQRSRLVVTDEADFRAMVEHLAERHWSRPSYLTVRGRPLLPVFLIEPLLRAFGPRRLGKLLASGDEVARAAGFKGIHYVAILHGLYGSRRWLRRLGLGRWAGDGSLAELGFRSISTYLFLPDWGGPARQSYPALIDKRVAEWPQFTQQYGLPFWPSVSPGWDARTRGVPRDPEPNGHPWAPLIEDETPAEFARLLRHWKSYAARAGDVPILPVTSWNEWTEGHAVAPCDRHGDGMLQALRAFKDSFARSAAAPVSAASCAAAPGTR
jgi:hypothetical protein